MITSYNDLTLGKYLDIIELGKQGLEDIDYTVRLLAILTDKDEDELLRMPLPAFKVLTAQLAFLKGDVPVAKRLPSEYRLNGRSYTATLDASKMTAAQYIDFQSFQSVTEGDRLVPSLSCILVPTGHSYGEGYDVAQVHADIREAMTVGQACSLTAFFLNQCVRSISGSLTFSRLMAKMLPKGEARMEAMREAARLEATIFNLNGVGSTMSQLWRIPYTKAGTR